MFPPEVSKKINPELCVIHHASDPSSHCLQQVIDEDAAARAGLDIEIDESAAARAALKDHVAGISVAVAWVDLSNTLFSMPKPTNSLLFTTMYVSSRKRRMRCNLTKYFPSDIASKKILATPTITPHIGQ
jgi:hypothetical protein